MTWPGLVFYQVCVSHSHSERPPLFWPCVYQAGVWNVFSSLRYSTSHTCQAFNRTRTGLLLLLRMDQRKRLQCSCLFSLIISSSQMLYNCFSPSYPRASQNNDAHLEHICVNEALCTCEFGVFLGLCVSAVCVSNMKSCDWQVSAPCAGNLLSNSCRLTSIFSVASSWVPLFCGSGRPLTGTCMWEQLTHDGHRDFKEGRGLGPAHHCTLWSCNFPANVHKPPVNNGIQETESLCGRALWSGISGQKGGRLTKCV